MPKSFPKAVPLKVQKCPTCESPLGWQDEQEDKNAVRVICTKDDCGYSVDLFWLGELAEHTN
ncbi:hypothetical protein ACFL2T_07675 [Elusimicrobiota bacterium]